MTLSRMARIMIADDSDSVRLVLKDILSIGKFELVGEAINGTEAVEKFNALKPDLLLLDLAMPKKDGLTVIKEIMATHPDAKIIVVTATDDQKIINECMQEGAIFHISKPFDFDKVITAIKSGLKD